MALVAGGSTFLADIALLSPAPAVEESVTSNPLSAGGTTQTVFLTLNSYTYAANSAWEAILEGGVQMSAATAAPLLELHKTNAAGAIIGNFGPRIAVNASAASTAIYTNVMFQTGSAVTAALCATAAATAGATVTIVANGQRQARLRVHYRGPASAWTNLPTLT